MSVLRPSDIITFFILIAILLAFAAVWMVISERNRGVLRREIKKLKSQIELNDREKFKLMDKMKALENSQIQFDQGDELVEARLKIDSLESENTGLKKELSEARLSLEEVYKALN